MSHAVQRTGRCGNRKTALALSVVQPPTSGALLCLSSYLTVVHCSTVGCQLLASTDEGHTHMHTRTHARTHGCTRARAQTSRRTYTHAYVQGCSHNPGLNPEHVEAVCNANLNLNTSQVSTHSFKDTFEAQDLLKMLSLKGQGINMSREMFKNHDVHV